MALVRALLAPTASGDGAGERFCASLPPSPHFSGACQTRLEEIFQKSSIFTLFWECMTYFQQDHQFFQEA
jgi:hypothetical protein